MFDGSPPVQQLGNQRVELITGLERNELAFLIDQKHSRDRGDAPGR